MQRALALVAVALSTAAPADTGRLLASPGLRSVGLTEAQTEFYSEHLAQQLSLRQLRVVSAAQVALLLGLARQRQLLGCEDDASCATELTNALGAEGLVSGSIGRVGQALQLDVAVLHASDGRKLALFSRQVDSEEQLLAALADAARELQEQLGPSWLHQARATGMSVPRKAALGAGSLGLVGAGLSVALLYSSSVQRDRLVGGQLTYAQAVLARDAGSSLQLWGFVALGVGAAALGVATAMWVVGAPELPLSATVSVGNGAVVFVIGGRWE